MSEFVVVEVGLKVWEKPDICWIVANVKIAVLVFTMEKDFCIQKPPTTHVRHS